MWVTSQYLIRSHCVPFQGANGFFRIFWGDFRQELDLLFLLAELCTVGQLTGGYRDTRAQQMALSSVDASETHRKQRNVKLEKKFKKKKNMEKRNRNGQQQPGRNHRIYLTAMFDEFYSTNYRLSPERVLTRHTLRRYRLFVKGRWPIHIGDWTRLYLHFTKEFNSSVADSVLNDFCYLITSIVSNYS